MTTNNVPGTDPFGAVVVKDGVIIGEGLSAMRANSDATAHGEVLAIRVANKKLSTPDLSEDHRRGARHYRHAAIARAAGNGR